MEPARTPAQDLDEDSASWLRRLGTAGGQRQAAERDLHALLVRIALAEVRRRQPNTAVTGPELGDIAYQAAADAMVAILAKLGDFRGESRFTTWAYRFVILEVSAKLGRHYWRNPLVALDAAQWERLPDRLGLDPEQHAEAASILAPALRALASLGYRLAVLSNGTPAMIANCLANSGLGDFFGERISVDEVRVFKPSPVVYQHAAQRLSVPPGQIRLVTSNAFDCVGASAAGMHTAWANRSAAPFDTIGQPPDITVPSLDRLPAVLAG